MGRGWTVDDMPGQEGKVALVTGANSGLGRIVARELARRGAQVVVAARDVRKGEDAAAEIAAVASGPQPRVGRLDLGSLASVRELAASLASERIDLLINNAGVMMTPQRTTSDGFELQFGTNHLGHFALTGLLLPSLQRATRARVVTVTSNEHRGGQMDFEDPGWTHGYSPRAAYQRSKLANAIFGIELDRRLQAAKANIDSVLAHPGYAATNLQSSGPTGLVKAVLKVSNRVLAQPPERGALPILYAATAPGVEGGDLIGPDGPKEMRGAPGRTHAVKRAYDPVAGERLWELSEALTDVRYLSGSTTPA